MLMLQQMLILLILMLIGFVCYKRKMITEETSKKLSGIVLNITNPAMILSAGLSKEQITGEDLGETFLLAVCFYIVMILIAVLLSRLLRTKGKQSGTYQVMTVFSNIGFMGFPIISAVFGKGALLYAALFLLPFNVLIYTYGIFVMKKEEHKEKFEWKKILNIGVLSCLITMVLYLGKISVPQFVEASLIHLSNLTAPLSMMIIGASLATIRLKELVTDIRLMCFAVIKLLIIPIAGTLLIRQFITNETLVGVTMVMMATPVGSMVAMLASEYEGDYELASKGVALTTVMSVATLPIVTALVL